MSVLKKLHRALVQLDLAERGKVDARAAILLAKQHISDAMGITYGVLDDLEGSDEDDEEQPLGVGATLGLVRPS